MKIKDYKPKNKKTHWFNPCFEVPVGEGNKALTDGHVVFFERPPLRTISPNGDSVLLERIEALQKQNDVTTKLATCEVRVKPRFVEKDASDRGLRLVWFSNGCGLDLRYYDMILSVYPNTQWLSDVANAVGEPKYTFRFTDGAKTKGFVMPMRTAMPDSLLRQFKNLKRTWFSSWIDGQPIIQEQQAIQAPSAGRWFITKAEALDHLRSIVESNAEDIHEKQQSIRELKAENKNIAAVLEANK